MKDNTELEHSILELLKRLGVYFREDMQLTLLAQNPNRPELDFVCSYSSPQDLKAMVDRITLPDGLMQKSFKCR